MFALYGGYQCWGHLWTSLKLLCSSLCSAEQLPGAGTLCSAPHPCWHPGRSALSPAWHWDIQCCACSASNFLVSPKKVLLFFFFNSRFQLSNDSDTAARVKWSSSPSELYSWRPWVSSLKESLLAPAISWIEFFNLSDGGRCSSSAAYLLVYGLCFSDTLNDPYKYFVFRSIGDGRLEGN